MGPIYSLLLFVSFAIAEIELSRVWYDYPGKIMECSDSSDCYKGYHSRDVFCEEVLVNGTIPVGGVCKHYPGYNSIFGYRHWWGINYGLAWQYVIMHADPDFPCESNEACNDMHNGNLGDKFRPNIKCIDNLCQCGPGYKWTQVNVTIQRVLETEGVDWAYHIMECHKSSVAPTSCIDKDNRLECDASLNMLCNNVTGACDCQEKMSYRHDMGKCLLNEGEDCIKPGGDKKDEYEDGLCHSQMCMDGKCACNDTVSIWSTEADTCVMNLKDKACADDAECTVPELNEGELMCWDSICRSNCSAGFIYFGGACVNASSAYGGSCDPAENLTCMLDPRLGLYCDTETLTCACGLRNVGKGYNVVDVQLVFNEKTNSCDVKPDGAPCTVNSECISGDCEQQKCNSGVLEEPEAYALGYKEKCGKHHIGFALLLILHF